MVTVRLTKVPLAFKLNYVLTLHAEFFLFSILLFLLTTFYLRATIYYTIRFVCFVDIVESLSLV
jgi:hypothetical protein